MTPLAAKTLETAKREPLADARGRVLHDLRISVIDQCNFRCTYCMPESEFSDAHDFLAREHYLSFAEIEKLARAFVALGVRKIRITGGEPLLRKNLPELIERLAVIPQIEDIALTTNGYLLGRQARSLASAGLNRVTVSLDSVDEATFMRMNGGRAGLKRVLDGIDAAAHVGLGPVKINAVIQRGVNDDGVLSLLERFRHSGHIVRLIEYMDVGTENRWRQRDVVPTRELIDTIAARWPLEPLDSNYAGEVAARYRYVDGAGEVGFISSVTNPFCGDCSRARVSPDGQLYTCLFATAGTDLKAALRTQDDGEQLLEQLTGLWRRRANRYSETRFVHSVNEVPLDKIEMYRIGG